MAASSSQWNLFGLDLHALFQWFRVGAQQLLWEPVGGIRDRLDTPVLLWDAADGSTRTVSDVGRSCSDGEAGAVAVRLPEDMVLDRRVSLPNAIESELEETIELEIQANSPFAEEDRCAGWRIVARDEDTLTVAVAIAARSEVSRLLRESFPAELGGADDAEVWHLHHGMPIVLRGFAEGRRDAAYRARLINLLRWGAGALLIAFLVILIPALAASMRAEKMQDLLQATQAEVAEELRLREELAEVNALLETLSAELQARPDYRQVLESLARVTPDSAYVNQVDVEANELRISGFGEDASVFMQSLTEQDWLREVTAPRAFQRDPRSGRERFTIDAIITRSESDPDPEQVAQNEG